MSSLTQHLQEADPLRHEAGRLDAERARLRSAVLAAASERPGRPRRAIFAPVGALLAVPVVAVLVAYVSGTPWLTPVAAQVRFEVRLAEERPVSGLIVAQVEGTERIVYLHPDVVVGNDDVAHAVATSDGIAGRYSVEIQLLPGGAARMRQASSAHVGRPLAILLDGRVVMAPTVRSPIADSAVISGPFTHDEATRIAAGVSRR
jgi:hypothetical protein